PHSDCTFVMCPVRGNSESRRPGAHLIVHRSALIKGQTRACLETTMKPPVVLCIDDEAVVLDLMQATLAAHGYVTLPARSGLEAIELAAARQFEAVILDYRMPDMTGGSVAANIKRIKPEVPILMFSGACEIPSEEIAQVDVVV